MLLRNNKTGDSYFSIIIQTLQNLCFFLVLKGKQKECKLLLPEPTLFLSLFISREKYEKFLFVFSRWKNKQSNLFFSSRLFPQYDSSFFYFYTVCFFIT